MLAGTGPMASIFAEDVKTGRRTSGRDRYIGCEAALAVRTALEDLRFVSHRSIMEDKYFINALHYQHCFSIQLPHSTIAQRLSKAGPSLFHSLRSFLCRACGRRTIRFWILQRPIVPNTLISQPRPSLRHITCVTLLFNRYVLGVVLKNTLFHCQHCLSTVFPFVMPFGFRCVIVDNFLLHLGLEVPSRFIVRSIKTF